MKNHFRIIIGMFIFSLFVMAGVYYMAVRLASNTYNEAKTELEEMVGKKVVLQSDTLMVVNYSVFDNTVTLDDGRTVSAKLVDIVEVKETE